MVLFNTGYDQTDNMRTFIWLNKMGKQYNKKVPAKIWSPGYGEADQKFITANEQYHFFYYKKGELNYAYSIVRNIQFLQSPERIISLWPIEFSFTKVNRTNIFVFRWGWRKVPCLQSIQVNYFISSVYTLLIYYLTLLWQLYHCFDERTSMFQILYHQLQKPGHVAFMHVIFTLQLPIRYDY